MAQKFHQRFNIEIGLDEARRRFVNRVNNFIFELMSRIACTKYIPVAQAIEQHICSKIGERHKGWGCLGNVLSDDYHSHLLAIEALFELPETRDDIDRAIKQILLDSEIDIGIRWDNGHFIFSGSPLLDEKLVNDVLGFLGAKGHDGVLMPFRKGLDHLPPFS